jgi:hypothetical protein
MATRGEELATRLEQVNEQVITAITAARNGDLDVTCPAEGWTAAAVGAHIGGGHRGILEGLVKPIVEGREIPSFSLADFAEGNARQAAENAAMPQSDILALLREHGAAAAAYVRGLSDDDLDRTTSLPVMGEQPVTTQQVIEWVLIGHVDDHLRSMRQGLGEP